MRHRSPFGVFFLPIITFGIYNLYWLVSTKNEMNRAGANIPTAWFLIIPFVNWWWLWKYGEGVEKVTGGVTSGVVAFILLFILGGIGGAIIQSSFNGVGVQAAVPSAPTAPAAAGQPNMPVTPPAPTQPPSSPQGPTPPTPPLVQ